MSKSKYEIRVNMYYCPYFENIDPFIYLLIYLFFCFFYFLSNAKKEEEINK